MILTQKKKYRTVLSVGKIVLILSLFILLFTNTTTISIKPIKTGAYSLDAPSILGTYKEYRINKIINAYLQKMSIEEKVGQLFMISFSGTSMSDDLKLFIEDNAIGGVVIMSSNINSQTQLVELTSQFQEESQYGMLIATDQEGGVVARIPWDEASGISEQHIGIVNREDFAYQVGKSHAEALSLLGINMNLAPVLDITYNPQSPLLSRSFGSNADIVTDLGQQMIHAQQDENIIVTAKHFPGIGRSQTDSHQSIPVIEVNKDILLRNELVPFKMAIDQKVECIMVGHALYPQIDAKYPSSLSRVFMHDILRKKLGFEGIIMTDDIHMNALNEYDHRGLKAFKAGADMILVVDSPQAIASQIHDILLAIDSGEISIERLDFSVKQILRVKIAHDILE